MQLTEQVRRRIIILYCLFFFFFFVYRYFTNGLLSQVVPVFFWNKIDLTTWIIQATGFHKILLNNFWLCLIVDVVYFLFPFIYLFAYIKKPAIKKPVGCLFFLCSLVYSVVYCCYPIDSIETHIAVMVFPIVFIPMSLKGFEFMLQAVRYLFLFFFFSAGVWKLALGGFFNFQQMSGIILFQHKELLVLADPSPMYDFYRWLITHPAASYWLYFLITLIELSFVIGFFTKKCDNTFLAIYFIFLIMNSLIMRIDYWRTLPFLLCLYYSKYQYKKSGQAAFVNTHTSSSLK